MGECWDDPFPDLQTALTTVTFFPTDEIRVAQGVYFPTPPPAVGPPSAAAQAVAFVIPDGVRVRGGYIGNEPPLTGPMGSPALTILSGDIDLSSTLTPNDSDTIVTFQLPSPGVSFRSTLEGFTIQFGHADGVNPGVGVVGGGVYIPSGTEGQPPRLEKVTIENCFARDGGAGICANGSFDAKFCIVRACAAGNDAVLARGGGVLIDQLAGPQGNIPLIARLHSCEVNTSRAWFGGGIHVNFIDPSNGQMLTQNLVLHNNGAHQGGGLYVATDLGRTLLVNATVANNLTASAPGVPASGGGAGIWYTQPLPTAFSGEVDNSIVWGNRHSNGGVFRISSIEGVGLAPMTTSLLEVDYSDVEQLGTAAFPGTNNINLDPLFQNAALADFRLAATSPCLDAGDDTEIESDALDLDEDGNIMYNVRYDRQFGGAREIEAVLFPTGVDLGMPEGEPGVNDMGAFEFDPEKGA